MQIGLKGACLRCSQGSAVHLLFDSTRAALEQPMECFAVNSAVLRLGYRCVHQDESCVADSTPRISLASTSWNMLGNSTPWNEDDVASAIKTQRAGAAKKKCCLCKEQPHHLAELVWTETYADRIM